MSKCSRSNCNLEVLVLEERGKPEYLEKNISEQVTGPITNSSHVSTLGLNSGHIAALVFNITCTKLKP